MTIESIARPQVQTGRMTAEQFYDYCIGRDDWIELVNGRVIELTPPNPEHGGVDTDLIQLWAPYVKAHKLGRAYQNTGFILKQNPDTVRGPDQAFVSRSKMAVCPPPERGFWRVVPDLVVEIVSPGNTEPAIQAKVAEYLDAGVSLVWEVYPKRQEIRVYPLGQAARLLGRTDTLDGGMVLPGLRVPLSALWEE